MEMVRIVAFLVGYTGSLILVIMLIWYAIKKASKDCPFCKSTSKPHMRIICNGAMVCPNCYRDQEVKKQKG